MKEIHIMKTSKQTIKPTIETKYDAVELEALPTTSAKVRYLTSKGVSRSEIAKTLNIRYQHVRNVQVTLLKKDM